MTDQALLQDYLRAQLTVLHERLYVQMDEKVVEVTSHGAARGMAQSGFTLKGVLGAYEEGYLELIDEWIRLEIDTRRRFGLRLTALDAERLGRSLENTVSTAFGKDGAAYRSLGRWGDYGFQAAERTSGKLKSHARRQVEIAAMEARMPKPKDSAGAPTQIINVNAPNYGVIASQIENLNVGIGGPELKAVLGEVLRAFDQQLPAPEAAEARDIVHGLTKEVARKSDLNESFVRQAFRRLQDLAQKGKDVATLVDLVTRLSVLVAPFLTG